MPVLFIAPGSLSALRASLTPRRGQAGARRIVTIDSLDGSKTYFGDCLFFSANRNASVLT